MTQKSSLTLQEIASSLFKMDHCVSMDFLDACLRKTYRDPERMLVLAVLEDAVACIRKYASASKGKEKRWFRETIDWILTENNDWLFSFNNVCEAVDLDPESLRQTLTRLAERKTAKRSEVKYGKPPPSVKRRRGERTVRVAA